MGLEISGAVSGVTTPGASRLQASQLQQRSTTMQRLHFAFVLLFVFFALRPLCLLLFLVSGPGCPGPWRFPLFVLLASRFLALPPVGRSPVVLPAPLLLLLPFLVALRFFFPFFFPPFSPLVRAPLSPAFCVFRPRVPWALALVCVCFARPFVLCVFFFASRLLVLRALSPVLCVPVGRWFFPGGCCPPPPSSVSRGFCRSRSAPWFFFLSYSLRPRFLWLSLVCGPWCPGPWRCVLFVFLGLPLPGSPCALTSCVSPACPLAAPWWLPPPPPPPLVCLAVFVAPARCLGFFLLLFFFLCAPPFVSGFLSASALCVVCFVGLPLLGSLCLLASFVLSAWRLAAPCWLPPPPPLCLAVFVAAARCCVPCAVLCCVSLGALLRRAAAHCAARCCAVVCCVALWCAGLVPLLVAPCPLALPVALGPCASRCCVVRCSSALCAVCCVCFVVAWWCTLLSAALLCAVCVPGCCAGRSLSSPLGVVLCFAVLVRLRCAVRLVRAAAGAWCCGALLCVVLFPLVCCGAVLGLVAGGCLLVASFMCRCPCLAAWSASLLLAWFAVVRCFPVSCSVVLCCRVVLCCCALLSCCGAVGACFALLWPVVLCCVVLLVGCAFFCPVVVSACCGALSLVLCVPCFLRSVRCGALLCWLWCLVSLCRVLWRCAVVWCCAVVFCCRIAVLFVCAFPSCGLSCSVVPCCGVLLVVCAVSSPVVAFVCCGALSLPAGTHKKHQLSYVSPRVGGGGVAGMPWLLRCPGLDAAHVPPAAEGRRKRRGWGTGGRGRYMANKRRREGRVQGRGVLRNLFSCFTRCSRRSFLYVDGVLDDGRDGVMFLLALRRLWRYLFVYSGSKFSTSFFLTRFAARFLP